MKWLIDLIQTPSAFRDDPWGYARNQIGHGYAIGFGLTLLLPWWVVIAGYIALETYQRLRRGADLSDNIEDFANVAVMVLAAETGNLWFAVVHALYLIAGLIWRMEESDRIQKGTKWQM